jgi:hypothetical protein
MMVGRCSAGCRELLDSSMTEQQSRTKSLTTRRRFPTLTDVGTLPHLPQSERSPLTSGAASTRPHIGGHRAGFTRAFMHGVALGARCATRQVQMLFALDPADVRIATTLTRRDMASTSRDMTLTRRHMKLSRHESSTVTRQSTAHRSALDSTSATPDHL